MFGLSLGGKLIQGSAARTWNCISQIANLVWFKLNTRQQIMPRQRRRHHSKSKSRSRSHSHDKERDAKRRKLDVYESPNHKRSVSPKDDAASNKRKATKKIEKATSVPDSSKAKSQINEKISSEVISIDSDSESERESTSGSLKDVSVQNPSKKSEETDEECMMIDSVSEHDSSQVTPKRNCEDLNKQKPSSTKKQTTLINFCKNEVNKSNCKSDEPQKSSSVIKDPETPIRKIPVANESTTESANSDSNITPKRQRTKKENRGSGNDSQETEETSTNSNCVVEKKTAIESKTDDEDDVTAVPEKSEIPDKISTTPLSNDKQKLKDETTPIRKLTPKQIQKKLESEKRRHQKEKEREEREKQRQEEKEKREAERLKKIEQKQKEKEEKEELKKREKELKQKEIEQKQKEKEEKEELKKREKEQKRKEKEDEKLKKQQEIDEKNKEKLKEEEKKQKAAAAFASFFVPKKVANSEEEKKDENSLAFMPFEVKSDMKLPPERRKPLTADEKMSLMNLLEKNNSKLTYLKELKSSKIRTCPKTWPCQESDDDVTIIEEDEMIGEKICEEKPKSERMRAKFLKFKENQRPAYYGTWRKKSRNITGRRPFGKEDIFDYEVDSDDDWEEEEQGENLEVGSDDDKENEAENEDYEVDNEFFVPHGHLSDDEVDDEENARLSPESLKQKLKLLKDDFDQDMKSKTQKIKPRSIGCVWYHESGDNVDEAIDRHLNPLRVISNGPVTIEKRDITNVVAKKKKTLPAKDIPEHLMPILVKLVHGNTTKRRTIAETFLNHIEVNNAGLEISKASVQRHISSIGEWTKNQDAKGKYSWIVKEELAEKYNVDLVLPLKSSENSTSV